MAGEALDVITAGLQSGLDKSGEFTDNLAEYTPLFKQAGFTSGEMLNILKKRIRCWSLQFRLRQRFS
ncbi:hypothetical protein ACT7C6_02270 [Bacillus paranthracis]